MMISSRTSFWSLKVLLSGILSVVVNVRGRLDVPEDYFPGEPVKEIMMATVVTEGLLRELAGFRAAGGCAISIYVDCDPSEAPTVPAEKTKFHALVDAAKRKAAARARDRGRDCKLA